MNASILNGIVSDLQLFNGEKEYFDPDSSLHAMKHYEETYERNNWKLINEFDFKNLKCLFPDSEFLRLYVPLKKDSNYRKQGMFWNKFTLSGEIDFNFNDKKVKVFSKLLTNENVKLLKFCNAGHHKLLNMSLLPATGKLNNLKGHLFVENEGYINYSRKFIPECLDRQDTFISALNNYFIRKDELVLSESGINKEPLINYLNEFSDIFDYCDKVLLIKDKSLINTLIENGAKPIKNETDVLNYINLAQKYWKEKEKNILLLFD